MKSANFSFRSFLAIFLLLGISVMLGSWDIRQDRRTVIKQSIYRYRSEKKIQQRKKIRDLDDVLDELDNADRNFNSEDVQRANHRGHEEFRRR